jgi:pimeloyl-ACP methyl ester carboxylesterase
MRIAFYKLLLGGLFTGSAAAQTSGDARLFDSDGVPIRYIRIGNGEPVLLIHGFGGRLEFWQETGVVAALIRGGFTVVAYDSRGHGESGKPYDPAGFRDNEVEDVRRLFDHLAIERAHVVGYSRGAQIAGRIVGRFPSRVRSLVMGGWAVNNPVETLSRADCLKTAELLAQGAFPAPLMRALSPPDAPVPTADEQAAAARQFASENDVRALAAAFRADCDVPPIALSALRDSRIPALAIVGESDGMAAFVHAMGNGMGANLQVAVIPGANHFTAPAHPEFVARLVSFLNGLH